MALTPEEQQELQRLRSTLESRGVTQKEADLYGVGNQGKPVSQPKDQPYTGAFSDTLQSLEQKASKIEQSAPIQAVLGFGDVLTNIPKSIKATVTGGEYEPVKHGYGTAYDIGSLAGEIAPWLIPGPHQATLPARLGAATAYSALTSPGESLEGAKKGITYGLVGEAIAPALGKLTSKAASKFTRADLVDNVAKDIQKAYKREQKEAYGIVKPYFDEYGEKRISNKASDYLLDQTESIRKYLSAGKKGQRDFYDKVLKKTKGTPTLDELQDLQSIMGKVERSLDPTDAATKEIIGNIKEARDKIQDVIKGNFDFYKPGSGVKYDEFSQAYAAGPGKFEYNKTMVDILDDKLSGITPKKLEKALIQGIEGKEPLVPTGHYLSEVAPQVSGKLQRSDLYQMGLGSLIGGVGAGPYGAAIGAATPKLSSELLSRLGPVSSAGIQNELQRLIAQTYPYAKAGAYGIGLAPENEKLYKGQ